MSDTRYITKELLEDKLGSKMETLSSIEMNPGDNFLSGKNTSPFAKIENFLEDPEKSASELSIKSASKLTEKAVSGVVKNVTKRALAQGTIGGETLELAGSIAAAYQLELNMAYMINSGAVEDLIKELTTVTVNTITEKTTKMLTNSLTTIAAKSLFVPVEIAKQSFSYFNEHKISLSKMIKELEQDAEKKAEREKTEEEKKIQKAFNERISKKIKKFKDGMVEFNDGLSEAISTMASYLENGPEWLANKLDKEVKEKLSYAQSFVDKYTKITIDEIDKYTYNQGTADGKMKVEEYNTHIMQKTKVKLSKIIEFKVKAIAKSKAFMQKAILKTMSFLGVNIQL